jgi:hypothetical protein
MSRADGNMPRIDSNLFDLFLSALERFRLSPAAIISMSLRDILKFPLMSRRLHCMIICLKGVTNKTRYQGVLAFVLRLDCACLKVQ